MILLVEDDEDIRALLTVVLQSAGYTVTAVEHPRRALDILATRPVDALITDFNLPEKTGAQLIRTVREHHPHIRVMLISGHHEVEALARSCHAQCWFRKGESIEMFLATVSTLMDRAPVDRHSDSRRQ